MTNLTAAYAELADGLNDVFRHRGWGLGHTFLIPRGFDISSDINLGFQRIDYIFTSPEIQARQVRVIPGDSGSDHRPVWAQFELSPSNVFASP
jgi:endonuclease/exonuclease/phosphatase family metal-dependent hydrolase